MQSSEVISRVISVFSLKFKEYGLSHSGNAGGTFTIG